MASTALALVNRSQSKLGSCESALSRGTKDWGGGNFDGRDEDGFDAELAEAVSER